MTTSLRGTCRHARRLSLALIIIAGPALALAVSGAATAAGGEFGNPCTASIASEFTVVMTGVAPTNPLPATAPLSGVITKARFSVPAVTATFPTTVKVLRPTGAPNQYTVVAQSASVVVGSGTRSYDVRIPVAAGDVLGITGAAGTLVCANTGSVDDTYGFLADDPAPGTTADYATGTGASLPLVATVEPDVDHDAFGDLSQDLCPQSAAFQTPCPTVALDSFATAHPRSITVVVTTSGQAQVTLMGTAKVHGRAFSLRGGTQTVLPGAQARFQVKVSKALKAVLAALPATRRITVRLTATSTDLIGRVTTDTSSVKLTGTHP